MNKTHRILAVSAVLAFSASGGAVAQERVVISGGNSQTVHVSGSITNEANSGATAKVNIGSVSGASVGSNSQSVSVDGSIHNQASGSGSKAIINIGSVSDE